MGKSNEVINARDTTIYDFLKESAIKNKNCIAIEYFGTKISYDKFLKKKNRILSWYGFAVYFIYI